MAGSELICDTEWSDSQIMKADNNIKSVLWLNLVVNELSQGKKRGNFCNSNLTQLLQGSMGGNSNTVIICAVNLDAMAETYSTLMYNKDFISFDRSFNFLIFFRFAYHAKNVKNTPFRNIYYTGEVFTNISDDTRYCY